MTISQLKNKVKNFIDGKLSIPIILGIGVFGWLFDMSYLVVLPYLIFIALVFLCCDDISPIFVPVLFVSFFVSDYLTSGAWILYGIAIVLGIASFLFFIIKKISIEKKQIKKGQLFWPLILLFAGYTLGGLFFRVDLMFNLYALAIFLLVYIVYWLTINFTNKSSSYFAKILICGGVALSLQLIISYLRIENVIQRLGDKLILQVGTQNINIFAFFITLATIATLFIALKNKNDYLYVILASFFCVCIFFTYSRISILVVALAFVFFIIYNFFYSQNKSKYIIVCVTLLILAVVFLVCFSSFIKNIAEWYAELGTSGNGRDELWPWCFNKFKENPFFGIGFRSFNEQVPGVSKPYLVLAHNTILQQMVSTGVVGLAFSLYYYVKKYKILFKNFNNSKLFVIISILAIAIFGLVNTNGVWNVFLTLLTIILIGLAEKDINTNLPKINYVEQQNIK